ncbi:MAG: dTDP-4-dehydrorhamnose reductase [Bacteroidales bacterium]|nr:dTDP-4-dehydrorhamnose reductase [Candidatus Latescibacterota bacterium]
MKKVYVTGSRGMLGGALVPIFSEHYEVRGTDLPDTDIRSADDIREDILNFAPDIVIHLASLTDVDGCELDPKQADISNRIGTENVAKACLECDAVMGYVSTGMIYNGLKPHPYIEYDSPAPISVYGRTKFEGELAIRSLLKRYYIFNTCWIFGGGVSDKKFVARIIDMARNNRSIRIVDDKFGSPTYTVDLASRIMRLISDQVPFGRYHCVNSGYANRYEEAREIIKAAGITGCKVLPVPSSEFPLPAARPRMEGMSNYAMSLLGMERMRDWRTALNEYVTTELLSG